MFGDFSTFEFNSPFAVILIVLATLLVPLVFLNLLIALVSEAFALVADRIIRTDYAALTEIILDLEEFMFWNRHIKKMNHLVVAKHTDLKDAINEGRNNKMANKITGHLDKQIDLVL
jgi:hypothetical protein